MLRSVLAKCEQCGHPGGYPEGENAKRPAEALIPTIATSQDPLISTEYPPISMGRENPNPAESRTSPPR